DAFSVSLANGLHDPGMKRRRMCAIAGVFAGFQALMPFIGWLCVHTIVVRFAVVDDVLPWIAMAILIVLGTSMIISGYRSKDETDKPQTAEKLGLAMLLMQGVATSIDALSVGITIADYTLTAAVVCALIIAAITFGICIAGLLLGRTLGTKIGHWAEVFGGCILIAIGIEIFVTHVIM
ncbi:MAG: manganese efflux pump, partial [Firmicutes bacterium]|nr:manganese efflux pump [Bacillota bacterium]